MNYEVKYLKNGELVIDLQTDDEDKAKYWANHLRTKGYKQVHIQHSFARGGNIVSSSELEPWATNISEQNLLRWTGYQTHSDYEREMDKPFEIKDFVKENQKDLSYIYLNPSKYGLDRDPVYMKEGGAVTDTTYPVGFNPEFLKTPILYGKEISLKMPNGESRKAKFAIVDMTNISASHNEKTYSSTTGYPTDSNGENVNDRNYTGDVSSQAKIIEFAQGLEPERLITTSRTPAGTPIITNDGIVVSGNNRTMSLKLAASDYPEKYEEYKEFLRDEVEAFGFNSSVGTKLLTGDAIALEGSSFNNPLNIKFTNPVLVRIDYDFPDYNALELSKYNKDTKKSERPIDKALKLGKVLASSDKCTSIISDVVGKYETFSEFYSNHADQKTIKNTLIDCNILTTQEIPAYFAETGFTEQGKELIENLLAGLVLSKDALIASNEGGARIFRQTIITSLPILTANKSLPENSLNDAINEALIMQSKMSSSKTSFQDYVAQIGMFGEATSEEGMFLNRLLNSGRNNFKKSIEAYNSSVLENQGESLFGEKPTKEEIFEAHVKNKIDLKERKMIENANSNIKVVEQTPEPIQPEKEIEIFLQPLEQKQTMTIKNHFVNGNFFKEKPDNILAKQSKSTDRWKKEITEYKGSLEDVKRIDAPLDFLAAHEKENPLLTVIDEPVTSATDTNTTVVDNLEKSITKSKKEVAKKVKRKTSDVVPVEELTDSYTVKEVWDMINPEVSQDELRAFMWWKKMKGRPIMSKEWMDLTEMNEDELYRNSGLLTSFVEKGLLYYFDGELLPAYLYLAENVYDKKSKLVKAGANSGQDAKYIIETYGQEVFDNQVKALEAVFKIQYDKRLMIRTDSEDALIINPVSKFSKEFMIKSFADGNPFKWKQITAGGNKRYGKPDFLVSYVADKDKHEFEELSLTDAFCLWLRTEDTIQFKKGMNYADIIKIYVQSGSKPATTAVKNADDQYVGAQLTLKKKEDAEWERLKSKTKDEGDRLFLEFMDKQLTPLDKTTIEMQWNRDFNGYVKINYNKVPVAFPCNKYDMGKPMEIRPEKREAVAFTFSEGSGLLAYDVGVGKTPSAVFVISQFLEIGYAKRPILVVPNQTYKQWIAEFKKFAGHIRINEFYNMSESFIDDWKDVNGATKMVPEGSVSIITYEGMEKLGFNETTIQTLVPSVGAILLQKVAGDATDKKRDREAEKLASQIEKIIGTALSHTAVFIEELGFDFISFDEAHACKKVFTSVAGEKEENLGNSGKETQAVSRYKIQSGSPSSRGVKGFMLCQYIQNKYDGNTLLLTATPFTNSPLEIYSMLAMVAHKKLKADGLDNLTTFFDTFVAISYEMIINSRLKPERRQVIMGFNNLISLQTLVRRFMNYKTGEEVNVPRPNKIVLPLRTKMLNGLKVNLSDDEKVETILPLSPEQLELMAGIKRYANGEVDEATMCSGALVDEEDEDVARAEGVEIDEEVMTKDEKVGVRLLKAMNHARNLALSPYIFSCSGLGTPTYKSYIETSNKLKYVMESIRTIKEYHAAEGTDMSGVVIYMDRGVEYFKLIREYLIKEVGFADHEVGIISSKLITPVPSGIRQEDKKEYVKNLFLGERFNTATLEMEKLTGAERCKVMIGSSTIKEGINLQKHSSVLFNCWMDWNPTDLQQLEGRIYRQGNKFLTVRIVNPLMIDSMDIFMFQKLEEKTSRINTIWANEGRTNVLKTEEFNPKDLKYSLIKDATVLAEMELLEIGEKIGEDIADAENRIKRNEKIQGYAKTIERHTKDLASWLEEYRPLADGQPERPLDAMLRLAQDVLKKQTDAQGKKMEYAYQRNKEKEREGFYSRFNPASKQYWFDDLNYANRGMIHEKRGYLVPNGVEVSNLSDYSEKIKKEIEGMKAAKESAVSPEAIQVKAQEIHAKREADHIEEKTVQQCIVDFKKLNYLLSHLKGAEMVVEEKLGPPLDAEGKVRVDEEGIVLLERAIEQDADTKLLHTDLEGNYTPERAALHQHIIEDMTSKTVCIDRGNPIAILTGGAPGSGKSTFLNKYAPFLQSDYIWKVDADAVREYFPEYEGWNSKSTHQETRDVVNKLITTFDTPCKHDLLYDGTMSNSQKYISLISKLKSIGYLVYIVYMDVPEEVSRQRAMSRFVNNKGGKTKFGRYVPAHVINDFFKTGKAGLEEIKNSVDGYIVVDSLTQKITEKGGKDIPTDRNYAEMFDMGKEEKIDDTNNVSEWVEAVSTLEMLLETDTKNAEWIEAVETLRMLLPEPPPDNNGGGVPNETLSEFEVKYINKDNVNKRGKASKAATKTWVNAKDKEAVLELLKDQVEFDDFGKLVSIKKVEKETTETHYISYLNKDNNFRETKKVFTGVNSYEDAVKWGKKNLPNFNIDMIRMQMGKGGSIESNKEKAEKIKKYLLNKYNKFFSKSISHIEYFFDTTDGFLNFKILPKGGIESVMSFISKLKKENDIKDVTTIDLPNNNFYILAKTTVKTDVMKTGGIVKNAVFTKDGIEVEKGTQKYKNHIFYDEKGVGYKCLGYFPKLDDCVYINQSTGNEVIGCMDGFFYNKPLCCGGPVTETYGKGGNVGEGVRVGDLISNAGKFGKRVVEIQGEMVYADGGYSVKKSDLKLINAHDELVPDDEWNEDDNHNYWDAKTFSYYKEGGPITTNSFVGKKYLNTTNNVTVVVYNVDKDNWVYLHVAGEKQSYANSTMYSPDDFDRHVRNGVYTPVEEKSLGGAIGKVVESDVVSGSKFKNRHGQVFIIDSLEESADYGTLVKSSLEGGKKGNYRDSLTDLVAFLNEEGSVKILADGGSIESLTCSLKQNSKWFVVNLSTKEVEQGFENKKDAIDFKNDMQFPDESIVVSKQGLKKKGIMFGKGGFIENQYIGSTPSEIWTAWNKDQKAHFISDHAQTLFGKVQSKFTKKDNRELLNYVNQPNYYNLPKIVCTIIDNHVSGGQYGLGGLIDSEIAKHKADSNYDEFGEEMNKIFSKYGELTEADEEYLLKATPIESLEYLKTHIKK